MIQAHVHGCKDAMEKLPGNNDEVCIGGKWLNLFYDKQSISAYRSNVEVTLDIPHVGELLGRSSALRKMCMCSSQVTTLGLE